MCEDCRVQSLERKKAQFMEPRERKVLHQRPSYPSKSKKVYRDRFMAARKILLQNIEWYQTGRKQGYKDDGWFYQRIKRDGWSAQRYRKARAEAKAHGVFL